jgi:hypothetical protein
MPRKPSRKDGYARRRDKVRGRKEEQLKVKE